LARTDLRRISIATGFPQTWNPDHNVAWKVEIEGRGHSSPVVWGDRIFIPTDIEGAVIPGAGAVKHKLEGPAYRHPDANGGDRKQTLKLLCFDANTGKRLWDRTAYDGRVFDDVTRFDTYASPTVVTDGKFVYAYFESQGLFKYDFAGELQWKMSLGGIGPWESALESRRYSPPAIS
jgi:outer membrane protein assembly factor BamB